MASPFPGSAVFLDLPFPIEPDEFDYEDADYCNKERSACISP